mgnify:CR=1 FL=1
MPKLMEREEWTATLESARRSNRVWCQRVVGSGGEAIIALPKAGSFEVIFVEIATPAEKQRKTSAKDMIGFGKRFHAPRPTDEWMKELREGED